MVHPGLNVAWMAAQGWSPAAEEPFVWSCDLDGALTDRLSGRKHRDWQAAGAALSYYLLNIPRSDRNIIAHSHGGQAVAYALAQHSHTPIRTLVTVCTPVRGDMRAVWAAGVRFRHRHVCVWTPGWKNPVEDVLEALGLTVLATHANSGAEPHDPVEIPGGRLDSGSEILLNALGFGPTDLDRLVERTGLAAPSVISKLQLLELEGRVESLADGRYSRTSPRRTR